MNPTPVNRLTLFLFMVWMLAILCLFVILKDSFDIDRFAPLREQLERVFVVGW